MSDNIMNLGNMLCKYYYGISQICMLVTVSIIAVISFDRHYTIKYGSSTSSSMKYILASAACWIYSLVLSLPGLEPYQKFQPIASFQLSRIFSDFNI